MKERLLQLLDLEHLSPSKFADLIGVQRSSVSHILSDRNKPSFDFLQKTLKTFPGLKADWLILGEGPIYEQMRRDSMDLFGQTSPIPGRPDPDPGIGPERSARGGPMPAVDYPSNDLNEAPEASDHFRIPQKGGSESKKIIQVMLLYDDDTFVTYNPSQ